MCSPNLTAGQLNVDCTKPENGKITEKVTKAENQCLKYHKMVINKICNAFCCQLNLP